MKREIIDALLETGIKKGMAIYINPQYKEDLPSEIMGVPVIECKLIPKFSIMTKDKFEDLFHAI